MNLKDFAEACAWRVFVAEIDGVLWASDSYWMMPLKDSLAEQLLAFWKLQGPGTFGIHWDAHVERVGDVPDKTVASMRTIATAPGTLPLSVVGPMPDVPPLARLGHEGVMCAVSTRPDGQQVFIQEKLLRIVGGEDWMRLALAQVDGPKTAVWVGAGLVMPYSPTAAS